MSENTLARLSVELPYEIHKQLKIKAVTVDKSIRDVIIKLLEDFLKE